MVLTACSSPTVTPTSLQPTPTSASAPVTTSTSETGTTTEGGEFSEATVMVGDAELTVWVADERQERVQGLRGVEELPAGIEGMLFAWDTPTSTSFTMADTLIPLDVWFFDSEGVLVGSHEMTPCSTDPCPGYPTPGPVSWALETPAGSHRFGAGDSLAREQS